MRSSFTPQRRSIRASSVIKMDENYDLRGLNMVSPDQIMIPGDSPYNLNCRTYARDDGESRVAIRTRKGSSRFTTAVGETLDTQNIATSTGDLSFTTTRVIAQPFNPTAAGVLDRLDLEIKKAAGATGHVIIELCSNNSGVPGSVIAQSSILASNITETYQYLSAYLIDAPSVAIATQYWIVVYIQDNGSGTYYVRQTADAGALDLQSIDDRVSWSALNVSFRFKSYVATPSLEIKGYFRRYPSDGAKRTIFGAGAKVYAVQDNGTVSTIDTGLSVTEFMRFAHVDDKTIWVNGNNNPRYTANGSTSQDLANAPAGATHVIVWQGRAFFVINKTLVRFTELYDFENIPSVNFFYVPDPKSSDPVTGWRVFQDNLVIFTHETKHTIFGSDISTFTRKEAIGTKGAVSDEAIAVDKNYCFFMDEDGNIQAWNGISDLLVSDKMEPEFQAIPNKSKVRLVLYRNQLRVYYQSPTSDVNDRMAILDLTYSNFGSKDFRWFKDTGRPVVGAIEWKQDNGNPLIEFSSRAGWLFEGEQGFSDLGKKIDWKYWTQYKTYGFGSAKKRIKRFHPVVRTVDADYTMLVGKDMDFANNPDMRQYIVAGGGAKWGAFVWGDGTKWGKTRLVDKKSAMSGRGRYIQYRFERNGVETPAELYGYIAQLKIGRPK